MPGPSTQVQSAVEAIKAVPLPTDRKLSFSEFIIHSGLPLNQRLTPGLEQQIKASWMKYNQAFEENRYRLSRDEQRRLDGIKDRLAKSERSGPTGFKGLKETLEFWKEGTEVIAESLVRDHGYPRDANTRELAKMPPKLGPDGNPLPGERPITNFERNPQWKENSAYLFGKALRHYSEEKGHAADDPLASVPNRGQQQQQGAQQTGPVFNMPGSRGNIAKPPGQWSPMQQAAPAGGMIPQPGPNGTPLAAVGQTPTLQQPQPQPLAGPARIKPGSLPHDLQFQQGLPADTETATNPATGEQIRRDPRTGRWMVLDKATGQWRPYSGG